MHLDEAFVAIAIKNGVPVACEVYDDPDQAREAAEELTETGKFDYKKGKTGVFAISDGTGSPYWSNDPGFDEGPGKLVGPWTLWWKTYGDDEGEEEYDELEVAVREGQRLARSHSEVRIWIIYDANGEFVHDWERGM